MDARTALSAGLFAAWAVHDAEEVATMAATSRRVLGAEPRKLPIPEPLRSRGLSQAHVTLSVAPMSLPVATAAFQGIRTRCRSRWFRGAVLPLTVGAHLLAAAILGERSLGREI